jgi:hypothetical protein
MAISPKSRGLGNIGSIVNRQRMASPTRPAPMPTPKLAPQMSMPIQRPLPNPFQSAMTPMAPQPAPEPFNPNPNPGQMPINNSGMNMFGGMDPMIDYSGMAGMQPMQQPMDMFGGMNPTVDYGGPAGMQPGQMFGNPNPMSSDYDELESSKFNTNPSMGGSMFSGNGFSGY